MIGSKKTAAGNGPYGLTIVLTRNGGLGNQMFEWAAGLRVARALRIPYTWMREPGNFRAYGLSDFGLECSPYRTLPCFVPHEAQGGAAAIPDILERAANIFDGSELVVRGLFQSEECFLPVADEVRARFALPPVSLDVPRGATPVGVQVRRGDYVKHRALNMTDQAYFKGAMNRMRELVSNPRFFIISDDPDWCLLQFAGDGVTVMPRQDQITGLRTMAACEAHIISNSTYGWWGAWLAEKGPVVVPSKWISWADAAPYWKPAPERWIRVPNFPEGRSGIPSHVTALPRK
jgi:hypothetical protein